MPGLDVLRGVAIMMVVMFHGLSWDIPQRPPAHSLAARSMVVFDGGWLGVFLFFVLSGFLITGILLDSKQSTRYWRSFYTRRVLRIIPPFLLVLIAIKIFAHATWAYLLVCLAYLANYAIAWQMSGFVYGPLWSLAVEEQFYLGWPWFVKFLSRRKLAAIAIASIVASPFLRYISMAGILPLGNAHTTTWLIADNLSMGGLLAIVLRSRWGTTANVRRLAWILAGIGVVTLFAAGSLGALNRASMIGYALETVPFEFLFAALLLVSLFVGDRPAVLTWTRPLRFLGYISYGLYLYHELVFEVLDWQLRRAGFFLRWSARDWALRFLFESTVAVMIAYVSRRYFEGYFLGLKARMVRTSGRAAGGERFEAAVS